MFGFGKAKREATQASTILAQTAIKHYWSPDGSHDSRIWSDPYVLGLIQGSVGPQIHPSTGRKLSPSQKDQVLIDVVKSLGAPKEALDLGLQLAEKGDPDFMRGFDNALITWLLMTGTLKRDAYLEPDIVAAKELAPVMFKEMRLMPGFALPDSDRELAATYIYLKVRQHKEAHYPSME